MQILAEAEDLPKTANMLLPTFVVIVVQGRHR